LKAEDHRPHVPEFIIGGAPRSGTTWLYHLLDKHPEVYMAKPTKPEPKFFLRDDLYARGIDHYLSTWFADIGTAKIAGEKSTNYLESPTAAARMREHLPGVKLVFILRDPVERAFSNYLWSRMANLEQESFTTALALEAQREKDVPEKLRFARPHAYFSRGLYAELLQVYYELFPREQILCLRYEDIAGDAGALACRLHEFLGVTPRPGDADGLGVINPSTGSTEEFTEDIRRELRARYAEPNRRLTALIGPHFQGWP
jgi:hypothetical protein